MAGVWSQVRGWLAPAGQVIVNLPAASGGTEDKTSQKDEDSKAGDDVFAESVDHMRTVSRWILTAFAAVAAILVAGSQLSSLGEFDSGNGRLWFAVTMITVALTGTGLIIAFVVSVESSGEVTLGGLVEQESNKKSEVARFLAANPSIKAGYPTIAKLKKDYEEAISVQYDAVQKMDGKKVSAATAKVTYLGNLVSFILPVMRYHKVKTTFDSWRWRVIAIALASGIAVGGFAWAANPADPPSSPDELVTPVQASLVLTSADDLDRVTGIVGPSCPAPLAGVEYSVVVLSASDDDREVMTSFNPQTPQCHPKRFTVDAGLVQPLVPAI